MKAKQRLLNSTCSVLVAGRSSGFRHEEIILGATGQKKILEKNGLRKKQMPTFPVVNNHFWFRVLFSLGPSLLRFLFTHIKAYNLPSSLTAKMSQLDTQKLPRLKSGLWLKPLHETPQLCMGLQKPSQKQVVQVIPQKSS